MVPTEAGAQARVPSRPREAELGPDGVPQMQLPGERGRYCHFSQQCEWTGANRDGTAEHSAADLRERSAEVAALRGVVLGMKGKWIPGGESGFKHEVLGPQCVLESSEAW